MKSIKPFIIFQILLTTFFSQAQNIETLKENNGFRNIKLGSNVMDYPAFVKKALKEF